MAMKISPTALFSVVLLVASVSALGVPGVNVSVTNFPLDEQGRLLVSQGSKPVEKYNGSVRISVISPIGTTHGVYIGYYLPARASIFQFIFQCEGEFLNVTDMWISYINDAGCYGTFEMTLNGVIIGNASCVGATLGGAQSALHIQDTNVYQAIKTGINLFEVRLKTGSTILLQTLDLFIEYEYQA